MVSLGFLGCAHIHTPGFIAAIKKRPDLRVTRVWDHDAERAGTRAKELEAEVANDPQTICKDKSISAIVICSETNRHGDLVELAAAARKDMFVEKPLGLGANDGYEMARAIEKAGVKFQTGYMMRGDPRHLLLKEQIDKNGFGKITRARSSVCHSGALGGWFDTEWRWMADPKQAGVGGFGDLGTHGLDLLIWLLGEIDTCTAAIDKGTARYPDCDEFGEALIRFKRGTIGTLAAGWDDIANPVQLEIAGTEGHATIINQELYFQSKHVAGADGKQPWKDLPAAKPAGFEAFLDAVQGKDAALVTPREAAYRSAVMEAMYESARQRQSMQV